MASIFFPQYKVENPTPVHSDPKTPEGFNLEHKYYVTVSGDDRPKENLYMYQYTKVEKRAATWSDLKYISICQPVGYLDDKIKINELKDLKIENSLEYKKDCFEHYSIKFKFNHDDPFKGRKNTHFLGYIPGSALIAGGSEVARSTMTLYNRVVKDENKFKTVKVTREGENLLVTKTVTKLQLSALQKTAIVMLSLASYIRGIITVLQLGIVFVPFDLIASRYQKV